MPKDYIREKKLSDVRVLKHEGIGAKVMLILPSAAATTTTESKNLNDSSKKAPLLTAKSSQTSTTRWLLLGGGGRRSSHISSTIRNQSISKTGCKIHPELSQLPGGKKQGSSFTMTTESTGGGGRKYVPIKFEDIKARYYYPIKLSSAGQSDPQKNIGERSATVIKTMDPLAKNTNKKDSQGAFLTNIMGRIVPDARYNKLAVQDPPIDGDRVFNQGDNKYLGKDLINKNDSKDRFLLKGKPQISSLDDDSDDEKLTTNMDSRQSAIVRDNVQAFSYSREPSSTIVTTGVGGSSFTGLGGQSNTKRQTSPCSSAVPSIIKNNRLTVIESYRARAPSIQLSSSHKDLEEAQQLAGGGENKMLMTNYQQKWWKRFRFKLVLGLILATILTSILVPILIKLSGSQQKRP